MGADLNLNASSLEGYDWLSRFSKESTVDLSKYPATAQAEWLLRLVPDGVEYTPDAYEIKSLKAGAITLFYLIDRGTQQLVADSFKNIAIKFDALSQTDIDNIKDSLDELAPFDDIVYSSSITFKNDTTYYTFDLNTNVFFYNEYVGDSVRFIVPYDVVPSGTWSSNYNGSLSHGNIYVTSPSTVTINGTNYKSYQLQNSYYGWPSATGISISSFDLIKSYITDNGFVSDVVNSELVDSSFVPYTVPSLRDTITSIDDIFPALEAIREGIISIPTTGTLASSLTDTLKDTIADTIADAIAKGISEVKEDDEDPVPKPDFPDFPDEIPPSYFPSFIPDLFPTDMFSIFKPVFDIVGVDYSMFDTWMLIPAIFIALFIFYIIISVL